MDLARLGDERLAIAVTSGRERAFSVIYERYRQPLYRYCRSMLHNDADAQDALHSTFAAALAALQRDRLSAPLRPWLFRIAHNESISVIRRRREEPTESPHDRLTVPGADEVAHARERLALLVSDLRELPTRQRSALVMRELSGLSHADIAHALGTTESAAKAAIFDARTALAEFSEGRALECEDVRQTLSDRDRRALKGRRLRAHLRSCASCAAFAAAIDQRRADLKALTPMLPPAASAAMLARLVGEAGGGGGSSVAAGGALGKLGSSALVSKATVSVAVIVTAAGVGGLVKMLPHRHSTPHPAVRTTAVHGPRVTRTTSVNPERGVRSGRAPAHARSGGTAGSHVSHVRTVGRAGSQQAASSSRASPGKSGIAHGRGSATHPTHPVHPLHPSTPSSAAGTKGVHPTHPVQAAHPVTKAHSSTGVGNAGVPPGQLRKSSH